jgi:hypothetical protein
MMKTEPKIRETSTHDDSEVANLTSKAHMDDLLVARLSRGSALKSGVSVMAGVLLCQLWGQQHNALIFSRLL